MKLKRELKTLSEETSEEKWNYVYYLLLRVPGSNPLESQTQQPTISFNGPSKINAKQQTKNIILISSSTTDF